MMKRRLVVMRHAKSSWNSEARTDHERPLNNRGKRDAPRMGQRIVELGWQPDFVLSSDSRRTRDTMAGLSDAFDDNVEVQFWRDLYHSGVEAVVSYVSQVDSDVRTVMILGHNPGWEHVVFHLTGEDVIMKTATAALLEMDAIDWNQAIRSEASWKIIDVIYPREL